VLRRRELLAAATGAVAAGAASAQPQELASAPLHRLPTGDLGALVAVDAQLRGTPLRCLIDSGASSAVISPRVARELRLEVIDRRRVATAGGVMQLERVALPGLEIGALRLAADSALVRGSTA
jgi:predicted aspartyl protease